MRVYKIPFEFKHENTMLGPISVRQTFYIVSNFLLFGFLSILPIGWGIKTFLIVPWLVLSMLFAFLRVANMYFDKFLLVYIKFFLKPKRYHYTK
ncbi:PrgI family mobile element protein [Thermoanaerobacter thermohydrosulfuricus]|uniref:PrgI family mobile element protein n=1 Tax=Thermoanaerobacter thermohydrosulfuricus TaxID=1516 RepID=UPI0009431227